MMPCNHNYELGQFLQQQDREFQMAEEREAMIEERAKDYMSEGERCDPYGVTIHKNVPYVYYNLFEGLSEIPESEQKVISEMWRDAMIDEDRPVLRYNLIAKLDKLVKDYWLRQAKAVAESEL